MRNGQALQSQQTQSPQQPPINEEYLNQLKALMNSKNASQVLTELALQNPQFRSIFEMAQNGSNMKTVFENLARQRGIDPAWILQKLIN